jgi:hypothetical protein
VRQVGRDQTVERRHELMDTLRWQIQFEELDGDKTFTLRIVRTEHRTQRPRTNLMKNTKRSKCVRRNGAGSFRVQ